MQCLCTVCCGTPSGFIMYFESQPPSYMSLVVTGGIITCLLLLYSSWFQLISIRNSTIGVSTQVGFTNPLFVIFFCILYIIVLIINSHLPIVQLYFTYVLSYYCCHNQYCHYFLFICRFGYYLYIYLSPHNFPSNDTVHSVITLFYVLC